MYPDELKPADMDLHCFRKGYLILKISAMCVYCLENGRFINKSPLHWLGYFFLDDYYPYFRND